MLKNKGGGGNYSKPRKLESRTYKRLMYSQWRAKDYIYSFLLNPVNKDSNKPKEQEAYALIPEFILGIHIIKFECRRNTKQSSAMP